MKRLLLCLALVGCNSERPAPPPLRVERPSFSPPQPPQDPSLPPGYCSVTLCNRIERFSLDPFSHLKDKFGEACFGGVVEAAHAKAGTTLSSESRWWQGKNINPTKKSVTRVKTVHGCNSGATGEVTNGR